MVEPGEYASGAAEASLEVGSAIGIEAITGSAITGSWRRIREKRVQKALSIDAKEDEKMRMNNMPSTNNLLHVGTCAEHSWRKPRSGLIVTQGCTPP